MSADPASGRSSRCWYVRVSDPVGLRDHFLRLGARAEIAGLGVVKVELAPGHELPVEAEAASWSQQTGVPAVVESAAAVETVFAPALLKKRLGELLVDKGYITGEQLNEALVESRMRGELLGRVLLERKWVFEDELARVVAAQLELPYVSLSTLGVDNSVARLLPAEEGSKYAAIPVGLVGGRIRVAFADPTEDEAQAAVHRCLGEFDVVVAEFSDIMASWRSLTRSAEAASW
jgi:MshEN domain